MRNTSRSSAEDQAAHRIIEILQQTAPGFDIARVAEIGLQMGVFSLPEADRVSIRGIFPQWLADSILSTASIPPSVKSTIRSTELQPAHECTVYPPAGVSAPGQLLRDRTEAVIPVPPMNLIEGGPSTHYMANFRQLSWSPGGLIDSLCATEGLPYHPFLQSAEPIALPGRAFFGVVEGASIYVHWLLDTLPRLLALVEAGYDLGDFDHFVLAAKSMKFHKEALSKLGIPDEKVVVRNNKRPLFSVESFASVTAVRNRNSCLHPRSYEMVNSFFAHGRARKRGNRRILISRSDAKRRRTLNEPELFEALRPLGFELVNFGDYSISETADLMADVGHVISPHGAGLANLIFCPPGTRVLEFFNAHISREYWLSSNQNQLQYFAFEVRAPDGNYLPVSAREQMSYRQRNELDLLIDIPEFIHFVEGEFLK